MKITNRQLVCNNHHQKNVIIIKHCIIHVYISIHKYWWTININKIIGLTKDTKTQKCIYMMNTLNRTYANLRYCGVEIRYKERDKQLLQTKKVFSHQPTSNTQCMTVWPYNSAYSVLLRMKCMLFFSPHEIKYNNCTWSLLMLLQNICFHFSPNINVCSHMYM